MKMTKEQVWDKYRQENTKLIRARERQKKIRKIVSQLWNLLKDTK